MSPHVQPFADLFRFNSRMVSLGLADLSPEDAVRRWKSGEGISIAYVTGHLCSSRYGLMKTLGTVEDNPFKEVFGAGVGSKDGAEYPSLGELRAGWERTAVKLEESLAGLEDKALLAPDQTGFPTPDQTLRGRIAFVQWHESYHVGQIGVLRTEMGYPSLRQVLFSQSSG